MADREGVFAQPPTQKKYQKIDKDAELKESGPSIKALVSATSNALSKPVVAGINVTKNATTTIVNSLGAHNHDDQASGKAAGNDTLLRPESASTSDSSLTESLQTKKSDTPSESRQEQGTVSVEEKSVMMKVLSTGTKGLTKPVATGKAMTLTTWKAAKNTVKSVKAFSPQKPVSVRSNESHSEAPSKIYTALQSSDSMLSDTTTTTRITQRFVSEPVRHFTKKLSRLMPSTKKSKHTIPQDVNITTFEVPLQPVDTSSNEDTKSLRKIQITPLLQFWLHDSTIVLGTCLVIAIYPTLVNVEVILQNQIPWSVALAWMIAAYVAGEEFGRSGSSRLPLIGSVEAVKHEPSTAFIPQGYVILTRATAFFPNVRIEFPCEKAEEIKKPIVSIQVVPSMGWSTLGDTPRTRQCWEKNGFIEVTEPLMNRLLREERFRRAKLCDKLVLGTGSMAEDVPLGKSMGTALEKDVIDPLFTLRGMDVFMTDGAEESMALHPFLIENGLRDKPTWVVNIMTQWANILVYMEVPEWVEDWDTIVEHNDDPNDVKAIKRFFNGDDDYRNARLRFLPCLVDGPMPIRVLAPPKRELGIGCYTVPTKWKKHPATTSADGRKLHPCLEFEMDIMSNKAVRGMSNLVKSYLETISMDVALTVDKPDGQVEDEPMACLSLWRFDKINVRTCPRLPQRMPAASVEHADVVRASHFVQLSETELVELERLIEVEEEQ